MNNRRTQEDFLTKYFYLSLYCKGSKRVTQGLRVRGSWRPNINCNILTPLLWPSTLCLSCSPDVGVHSAGCWLSLLHLISIFSGPQLIRASSPFVLVWLSLPHLVPLLLQLSATQLPSVQFVGLILPSNSHAEIWTRLHASAISSDVWRSGCVTSAIFKMACVIVIERK